MTIRLRLQQTLRCVVWYEPRLSVLGLAQRARLWEAPAVMGEQTSDDWLIYAIARGDRAALASLYDRHSALLLALATRILRDAREAEDLLHDVFVEVWKHAGDFDPARASARTWLCLRMRSRCLDRVRLSARRKGSPIEEAMLDGTPETQSAGSDALRLRAALAELPELQRQVLMLGYFQGLSSQEIADTLNIPVGTVKSRVAAALNHLRTVLGARELEGVAS